jgi:hypothetical protein
MIKVYQHRRKDTNQVFYIGIAKLEKRPYSKNGRNSFWKKIVNKVGFEVDILYDNLNWKKACQKEKELIKKYGRRDLGLGSLVNMTDGGDGNNNIIFSESTRKKMSLAKIKNNPMHNKEIVEKRRITITGVKKPKHSEKIKGINNPMYGISPEKVKCIYCKKIIDVRNAKRWHFENCKLKN